MARPGVDEVRAWLDVPATELDDEQLAGILLAESAVQARFCRVPRRRPRPSWPTPEEDAEADLIGDPLDEPATEDDRFPWPLRQALLRRCARAVAARGLPLGTLPVQMTGAGGEFGAALLPRLDSEIERYEAAYRIIAVA